MTDIKPFPPGTLLVPLDPEFWDGQLDTGVIIEAVEDEWGLSYKVLRPDGILMWVEHDNLDMFEVVQGP